MSKENIGRRLNCGMNTVTAGKTLSEEQWLELHKLHCDAIDVLNRQREQIRKLSEQVEKAQKVMKITGDLAESQLRAIAGAQYHFPEMEKFDIEDQRDQLREYERESRNREAENESEMTSSGPRV